MTFVMIFTNKVVSQFVPVHHMPAVVKAVHGMENIARGKGTHTVNVRKYINVFQW